MQNPWESRSHPRTLPAIRSRQTLWLAGISLTLVALTGVAVWGGDLVLRTATRLASVDGLVASNLVDAVAHPWIALGLCLLVVAFGFFAIAQVLVWYCAVDQVSAAKTFRDLAGSAWATAGNTLRKGWRARKFMAVYLLVILPLGGVAVVGAVGAGLEIPEFVVSEVMKFSGGKYVYWAGAFAMIWLNLRLALSVPALVRRDISFPEAAQLSWRVMRWPALILVLPVALAPAVLKLLGEATTYVVVALVRAIEAVSPAAALIVAGVSITVAELLVFALIFLVSLYVTHLTLEAVDRTEGVARESDRGTNAPDAGSKVSSHQLKTPTGYLIGAGAIVLGLAVVNVGVVNATSIQSIQIIAHRGVPNSAVENSLEGLAVAADLGADYVELDVLETKDHELVVFHDLTLIRLAGNNQRIADLTLDELQKVTLQQGGFTAKIPTLEEFLKLAQELDQKLLVELKTHGNESSQYVSHVVELLEQYGPQEQYLVQASSASVLEAVRRVDPSIPLGYIVPFAFGVTSVPDFDFYSVEQGVLSRAVARQIPQDADVYVWTVNDERTVRRLMTESQVDGVITSDPKLALGAGMSESEQNKVSAKLEILLRSTVAP